MQRQIWHILSAEEICRRLKVNSEKGLGEKEVERRLSHFGHNVLDEKEGINPVFLFLGQFKDFMVMVLMVATLISGLLGEVADAITILAIIFLNAVLGFIQEYKAERSMESLRSLAAPEALAIRDGLECRIPAADLVPGDIVILEAGDRLPADIRWLKTTNIRVDEAALTGESQAVNKSSNTMEDELTSMGDRKNMGYMGTIVVSGRGTGIVVETGMDTEMGDIADMIQSIKDEETPLQKRLGQLGKWLVAISIAVCVVVVITGILQGESFSKMFFAGVSLAVAAIPEGLPAIVTVSLALGVQRMVKRKAIIRKLPAVETLGCATIICSDKTGTLTQNEMTVRQIYCEKDMIAVSGHGYDPKGEFLGDADSKEKSVFNALLKGAVLCNNAYLSRKGVKVEGIFRKKNNNSTWGIEGDPTEGALLVAGAKAGIWRETIERKEERVCENPFDSERKMMSVIYRNKRSRQAYVKGAPDSVLRLCTSEMTKEGIVTLSPQRIHEIIKANDEMASQALRVLAIAQKDVTASGMEDNVEENLTFLGLIGMIDPPRPSAIKAIKMCREAGIKPVMITGDHKLTAQAVARELGIIKERNQRVITGQELDKMSEEELEKKITDIAVFARVAPKDKLRIVKALKKQGHIVAMTGDGVNDAPAVKEADIGVAMGIAGTDVTKEASSMVISDDNFATIVAAVEEGRGIYDNIRKFIRYLLSCNLGEVLTMFIGTLVGLPLPLLPIQILWVNLVTDGLPAMALGVDRTEPDIMKRPPRKTSESVFADGLGWKIIINGTIIGFGTLLVFIFGLWSGWGLTTARTMAFTTLVMAQLFQVFDCKSDTKGIFEVNIFSNLLLIIAVLISTLMQLAVIYLPVMQGIFQTTALNSWQWMIILFAAGGPTIILGLIKLVRNIVYGKEQYV